MNVTFVGTGYVGLVTGTCLAEVGNDVTCVDVDQEKIRSLRQGNLPIYEPDLGPLVSRNYESGRLDFTTDLAEALDESEIVFVAVGTPQREDGSADLQYVWAVIDEIREKATEPKVVVIKSTVPVGTNAKARSRLNDGSSVQHSVASNPEFLREGLAVGDCLRPDRIVLGTHDDRAREILGNLYQGFADQGVPVLFMRPESSEMTKYVANCMLATKVSYINEMANMCEAVSADINDVREGIGHDKRIGFQFFAPGVGYGGSCFPKDVRAMKSLARNHQMPMRILEAVDFVNESQKYVAFGKLTSLYSDPLHEATVAVWGLAFKPDTDDVREAPSLVLINQLIEAGVDVRVYDPEATDNVRAQIGDAVTYCGNKWDALKDADVLCIMTEWDEFARCDLDQVHQAMPGRLIIDGRNLFSPLQAAEYGFTYASIGRATTHSANGAQTDRRLETATSAY